MFGKKMKTFIKKSCYRNSKCTCDKNQKIKSYFCAIKNYKKAMQRIYIGYK